MILADPRVIEAYTARGWWGTETLDEVFRRNAALHPQRLALVDPPNRPAFAAGAPRRLRYAELDAIVEGMAARMAAAGVGKDDVVAFQLPNTVEPVILLLACARIGAIVSPLLPQFDANELQPIVGLLKPALFFTVNRHKRRDLAAGARQACRGHGGGVIALDGDEGEAWLAPAAATAVPAPRRAAGANDVFTVCWTSGTEGRPKGAMRTHNNWLWTGRIMCDGARLRDGDVIMNVRPLVNIAAIGGSFASWLACAGTLVMHPPLDVELALRQIREERVQATFMPPAFFMSLLADPALAASADLSSLRVVGTGSAAIPGWVIERMERDYGVELVNFFGANEGTSLLSSSREVPDPAHRASYFPRLGRREFAWPSLSQAEQIESRLVDADTGEEIDQPNRPGELRLRSPSIFMGYFGEPALTRSAFDEQGYLRTGDLFEIPGDGELRRYYRFVGRCKDIIVRGGLKIAPAELDELLSRHPLLEEAAAFPYPDRRLGEKVGVAAVPRPGAQVALADVVAFLKEHKVAVYKLPERLMLLDRLPRNALHKVLRRELAGLAASHEDAA